MPPSLSGLLSSSFLSALGKPNNNRFLACFRALVGGIPAAVVHESSAKVHGSFGTFLATQQHNQRARRAFLCDLTNHANPEPESLSVEVSGHFIPIY